MKKQPVSTKSGFHALVWQEGKLYVAKAIEIELASQGKSKGEAIKNLEEALALYFEDEKIPSFNSTFLQNLSFEQLSPRLYA
jgi:predicted RNase H-like HicB family nuclease